MDCKKTITYGMVKAFKETLEKKELSGILDYSDTEIKKLDEAMKRYETDCNVCKNSASNDAECQNAASTKLQRALPFAYKNVYPWRNYDWNYSNFIDNNYSTLSTGATKEGSLSAMSKNFVAFRKIVGAFLEDANPNEKSVAGGKTKNDDYPYYECTDGIRDLNGQLLNTPVSTRKCRITQEIKYGTPEQAPTVDDFLKGEDKIKGERASSYYVKVGNCPRPDIKNQNVCETKGYMWTPMEDGGTCSQPRYAYINNTPGYTIGGKAWKGLVPSIAKDFLSLTPDKLISVANGENIEGVYELQQCPIVEGYRNKEGNSTNGLIGLLIVLIVYGIIRMI